MIVRPATEFERVVQDLLRKSIAILKSGRLMRKMMWVRLRYPMQWFAKGKLSIEAVRRDVLPCGEYGVEPTTRNPGSPKSKLRRMMLRCTKPACALPLSMRAPRAPP